MADELLVRGAGQVARATGSGDLASTAAAMQTADFISEGTNKVIQARNRLFNSAMKAELEKTGDLTDKEYKKYARKLRNKRFEYVYLNRRGRASLEKEVEKEATDLTNIKNTNTEISNTKIENPSRDLGPCNADAIAKIVSGDMEVVYDKDGNPGYNMPDGRECFAAEQEELREFVKVDESGAASLASYQAAWDDGRFEISEDGKTKTDKFGNTYSNDKKGYQAFVDASEAYWKTQHDATGKKRKLDIDTQTGEVSTHPVWDASPVKMLSPMKQREMQQDTEVDEKPSMNEGKPQANKNFKSLSDIKNMVKEASVDDASFSAIQSIVANSAVAASNIQPGENNEFNYNKNYNNIKQQIIVKGNLKSLARNTNPFGRVFMTDLTEAIMSSSYEQLGIPSAMRDKGKLEAMDPTPKTPIEPGDAQVIARAIFTDNKLLTDYVTEYYTNMAEQNFNDNLKPEVAQNYDYKLTHSEALASARKRFGPGKTFTYKGRVYSTTIQQDIANDENEFA